MINSSPHTDLRLITQPDGQASQPQTHEPASYVASMIETQDLTDKDIEGLERSWVTSDLAARAGIARVDTITGAEIVGRTPKAGVDYAGLIFPYLWPGEPHVREYRLRRDRPDLERTGDGKIKEKGKYLAPPGKANLLYFPPGIEAGHLRDTQIPMTITEGEKKALALMRFYVEREEVRVVIGLSGVWNWRGIIGKESDDDGHRQNVKGVIPDFDRIDWYKREVEIVFDSNVRSNTDVAAARRELAKELIARGAAVLPIDLPEKVEGISGEVKIDDLLYVAGPDFVADLFDETRKKFAKRQVKTMAGNITFTITDKGVYATDAESGDRTWVCSPLYIEADTRDARGDNWGRLLRFTDSDGREHKWAMPMSLLSGDGKLYRERLLDMGLLLSPISKARNLLDFYLSTKPDRKVRCVDKIGWHSEAYVFPDETIGANDGEEVYLQANETNPLLRVSGTLEEWQETISYFCIGNSRLVFAVSLAFAASLIGLVGEEGGGFHFRGESTEGKTTALYVAGSVWGGGSEKGFLKRWKATGNGLEHVSACHNDSLLCLDELAECDPREVGSIAYMLANGQGKIRSHRGFQNRPLNEWRLFFLSSGEIKLSDMMAQSGQRIKGGQEVRFVNIESNAQKGYGLFDELHDFKGGAAFSKHLVECSKKFYGTAIREFIKQSISERLTLRGNARNFVKAFVAANVPKSAGPEVGRVANRFGLAAFAGERATAFGITRWQEGEATRAAAKLFQEWLADRGTAGSSEEENAVRQVRAFLEAHGSSRFQSRDEEKVLNRVGFKEVVGNDEIHFLIQQEAFRREVCAGFDPETVARALAKRRFLIRPPSNQRKFVVQRRVPELGRSYVYVVSSDIFSVENSRGDEKSREDREDREDTLTKS